MRFHRSSQSGFTLIELMITVAILGILAAIAITQYAAMLNRTQDANAKGNLTALRSALRIYYADLGGYPTDNLSSIVGSQDYLPEIPILKTTAHPIETRSVTTESVPSEVQTWSYNNSDASGVWGHVAVGCLHQDSRGEVWTTY